MDKILIKDLLLRCTIGVTPEERREKEDIMINIALTMDLHEVGKSDLIDDTVNYSALKKRIIAMVEHSQYSLIEALADRIASICLEYSKVLEVDVIVEKPGALRFARSVGVEITRRAEEVKTSTAFIGIGSNINPQENILKSIDLLKNHLAIISSSKFYKTKPLGNPNDPYFVNGVIQVETRATPEMLKFSILRPLEEALGRKRTEDKNAPRTIDLDILFYDYVVIKQDNMMIPDPQIAERDFLAVPLAELAPNLVLPGWNKKLIDHVGNMKSQGMIPMYDFSKQVKERAKFTIKTEEATDNIAPSVLM